MRTAIVTDAERPSALSIIRSLDGAGWRVVAASPRRAAVGRWSRRAAVRARYPDPLLDPDGCVEALVALARREGAAALFPVTDYVGVPLDAARSRFEGVCALALGPPEALAVANDKAATTALAESLGVPVPRSQVAGDLDAARAAAAELGWPVVLKPLRSLAVGPTGTRTRLSVAHAADDAEVVAAVDSLAPASPLLVQEHRSGEAQSINLLAADGVVLAALQQRRVREYPVSGGPGSCREAMPIDAPLLEHARRLVEALRWSGVAMVEFKVGEAGPVLLEINGRVWGSFALGPAAGIDLAVPWAELVVGGGASNPPRPSAAYEVGTRSTSLTLELKWMASVLASRRGPAGRPAIPRRRALDALVDLLRPGANLDTLRWDDPLPVVAEILALGGSILRRVGRG